MKTVPDVYPDDGVRILSYQQTVGKIMSEDAKIPLRCSFCGKGHKQVGRSIAGPSVFICDACVALCQVYLDHPQRKREKLLFDENLRPLLKDGEPVFVPITAEEEKALRDRYDLS